MTAIEPLYQLIEFNYKSFSSNEKMLLEAIIFTCICEELKEFFKTCYRDYFRIMKFDSELENAMMEAMLVRCIVNDILNSGEYTLLGLANYTCTHEDVIDDLISGKNSNPSAALLRKIIELHRLIRPNLYREILKKIINESVPDKKNENNKESG